jgi:hypothetical protein
MLQALYVYHCESIYHIEAFMSIKNLSLFYLSTSMEYVLIILCTLSSVLCT